MSGHSPLIDQSAAQNTHVKTSQAILTHIGIWTWEQGFIEQNSFVKEIPIENINRNTTISDSAPEDHRKIIDQTNWESTGLSISYRTVGVNQLAKNKHDF